MFFTNSIGYLKIFVFLLLNRVKLAATPIESVKITNVFIHGGIKTI
jgi:hypothetical protein